MKKELYTIGEAARLFGISTQTLRFYDREGILSPIYTNPTTGYRYYSYKQFHVIDRIKYLQSFGLALEDICSISKGRSWKRKYERPKSASRILNGISTTLHIWTGMKTR